MAVPKQKTSNTRKHKRRTHKNVDPPSLSECPQCNDTKRPHRVCPNCGYYKGRQVLSTET